MSQIAEVTFEMESGATIVDYIPCKSPKSFGKGMNKMLKKGVIKLGPVKLDTAAVTEMIISLLLKTTGNQQFVQSVNVSFNDKATFEAMRGTRLGGNGTPGGAPQGGK